MRKQPIAFILATMFSLSQTNAFADEHFGEHHDEGRHHEHQEHHEIWRGNIHRFHEQDFETWKHGRWLHARHGGTYGWWWVVNGVWYTYPTAIYPYPDPYTPPAILVQPSPPAVVTAPNTPAPGQIWYYCSNPQG